MYKGYVKARVEPIGNIAGTRWHCGAHQDDLDN